MPTQTLRQNLRAQWRFLSMALLLLALLIASHLALDHRAIGRLQRDLLANQAALIEVNLVRQLASVSAGLASVIGDLGFYQGRPDGAALISRRLVSLVESSPGVRSAWLLDAKGVLLAGPQSQWLGQSFADRDYITKPRQHPSPDTLYVSAPFVAVGGNYSLNVSRAALDAKGQLAHVLTARLDPDFFDVLLGSVRFAPDMMVALAHGNSQLLTILPRHDHLLGLSLDRPGSFFQRHIQAGSAATVFEGRNGLTGETGIMAQRTLQPATLHMDFPLVVAVSRSSHGIYADWWQKLWMSVGLLALLTVVSLGAMWQYQRQQRRLLILTAEQERIRDEADAEIRRLAFYDPLTGLPNRRRVMDRLQEVQSASVRHHRLSALLFIDLDNFKPLNDNHGHAEGDLLLQQVAQRLLACVRTEDTVGRLGGDEFVVLLHELDADPALARRQAAAVVSKLLKQLAEPYPLEHVSHRCTASIGVALFGLQHEETQAIVNRADTAMYRAKDMGRNTCAFAD